MGVFITAYARSITINAAQNNYDIFAYADTDSLHLLTDEDPDNLEVDPYALGAWKLEYRFDRALFVRAKTYIEEKSEPWWYDKKGNLSKYETHVAGLSVKVSKQLTLETFMSGEEYEGNLKQKIVPGGVILEDVKFRLPEW